MGHKIYFYTSREEVIAPTTSINPWSVQKQFVGTHMMLTQMGSLYHMNDMKIAKITFLALHLDIINLLLSLCGILYQLIWHDAITNIWMNFP